MKTPDAISPIRAYRSWNLSPGMKLRAVAINNTRWTREMEAHCANWPHLHKGHVAPVRACVCGIYACKALKNLLKRQHICARRKSVVGEVDLWGDLIEHDWGYRAQHARIVGIYRTSWKSRFIAARNGVRMLPRLKLPECGDCHRCRYGHGLAGMMDVVFAVFTMLSFAAVGVIIAMGIITILRILAS